MAKIIIGTDMDDSGFEKKYRKLKERIEKDELDLQVKSSKLEDAKQKLREANIELEKQLKIQREINGTVSSYEKQYASFNEKVKSGEHLTVEEAKRMDFIWNKIDGLRDEQEEINKQVDKYNEKVNKAADSLDKAELAFTKQEQKVKSIHLDYEDFNKEIEKTQLQNVNSQLNNIGRSINSVIKKIGRWALAVFGVRSAYLFVRNAINTIAQEDAQLKNDIETIRIGLAYTIEPLVRKIVELAKLLFQYIGYIVKVWTGGKVDIFARAKQNLGSAAKSAKELEKTSASFDKFNKLGSNAGTSGGTGGGISSLGELDKYPKWVDWIAQNKKAVEALGIALLAVFGATNIAKLVGGISTLITAGLTPLATILLAIAAPIVIYFAAKGLKNLIKQVNELNDQLDSITRQMQKNKDANDKLNDSFWELYEQGELNEDQIKSHINSVKDQIDIDSNLIENLKNQKTWLGEIFRSNKKLDEQIKITNASLLNSVNEYKKLYDQGLLNEQQQKDYKIALEKAMETMALQGKSVENLQNDYKKLTGESYEIKVNTQNAQNKFSSFINYIKNKLKELEGFNFSFSGGGSASFGGGGGGGARSAKGAVLYSSIPKLAAGGIVNMPGRGVSYRNAIIGERGAEAVVPLTDRQQMEMLGATIGKYVSVNADITLELESRILARVMKEITNNNNFMKNGG